MKPPVTKAEGETLITQMRTYYRNQKTSFKEDDLFYEGNFENKQIMSLPEGFTMTVPPTGRAIVDEGVDNVDPSDIRINYSPRGDRQIHSTEAETISRFLKNLWVYWRQTNSDVDVLRDFIKNLFKNGKSVWKLVPDWSLWPSLAEEDEKNLTKPELMEKVRMIEDIRKAHFPLVLRSLPPGKIQEDPTMNGRKLWVIETYDSSNDEMLSRFYKYRPELADGRFDRSHSVQEIWTAAYVTEDGELKPGRHFIYLDNELVNGVIENGEEVAPLSPYWDVPYIIKHSGFGRETLDAKPEEKATGFYTLQVRSMLKAEIRRLSHFDALMAQLAFPIAMLPDELESVDFDFSPGAINWIPDNVQSNLKELFLQVRLPTGDYLNTISMLQNQIERGTTQRAIRGAGVPGTDSAAQLQMITSQAKLRIDPVKRVAEEAIDEVNARVLWFIENIFKEKMTIWAVEQDATSDQHEIKPSMIKGRHRTRTTFMPNEELQRERKLILASEAMTKMRLNEYDAYVWAGFENASEMVKRNLAFKMLHNPLIEDAYAREIMKEVLGLDPDSIEMISMQSTARKQQAANAMFGAAPQQQGAPPASPPQATGRPLGGSQPPPGGDISADLAVTRRADQ